MFHLGTKRGKRVISLQKVWLLFTSKSSKFRKPPWIMGDVVYGILWFILFLTYTSTNLAPHFLSPGCPVHIYHSLISVDSYKLSRKYSHLHL